MHTNGEDHSSNTLSTDDVELRPSRRGDGQAGPPPDSPNGGENDENDKNDRNDTGRTFEATRLPSEVYDHLPDILKRPAGCLDGHERDTFLTGALPVCAGAMPNVRMRYGGEWLSLNHYMAVIAPPGSGKGKLRVAKDLGDKLDERLYDDSRQRIDQWEDRRDANEDPGPRPQERTLFLPGDSSAAELKQMLQANPSAVMFETEFATVSSVLDQEWGQFRDVLLKAYQNEPVSVARKGDDLLRIGHPAVSLALSGTPDTFREIVGDVEDGLFSRFNFFMFEDDAEWEPQFADQQDWELDEYTEEGADRLDGLHSTLSKRDEPLYITFSDPIKEKHTAACSAALEGLKNNDVDPSLYSSVKRAGLNALRFAGIFSLLRLDERAVDLSAPKSVAISERDLCAGLHLAFAYLSHALRVADYLEVCEGLKGLHEGHRSYLDALPQGAFDTADADRIADDLGIEQRQAQRWRKKFVGRGLLVNSGHGEWRKPASDTTPGVLNVHALLRAIFSRNGNGMDGKPVVIE